MEPPEPAALGVAVIPCHPRSTRPRARCGAYRPPDGRRPTRAEPARWLPGGGAGPAAAAGAVCGRAGPAARDTRIGKDR